MLLRVSEAALCFRHVSGQIIGPETSEQSGDGRHEHDRHGCLGVGRMEASRSFRLQRRVDCREGSTGRSRPVRCLDGWVCPFARLAGLSRLCLLHPTVAIPLNVAAIPRMANCLARLSGMRDVHRTAMLCYICGSGQVVVGQLQVGNPSLCPTVTGHWQYEPRSRRDCEDLDKNPLQRQG